MEDKIEVREYVRTKRGIARVTNIDSLDNVAWTDREDIFFGVTRKSGYLDWYIHDDGIVLKHSKNIIDLIEVGDYVNDCLVVEISRGRKYFTIVGKYGLTQYEFQKVRDKVYNVKSIVTKEQFSSMKYEVFE